MGDESRVKRILHPLCDLLHRHRLVALHEAESVEVLLHGLELLVHVTAEVSHSGAVLVQVRLLLAHFEVGEAVQSRLDCHLEAGLQRRQQVVVVHVDYGKMDRLNKILLLDDHVSLNNAIQGNQDNQIGVQNVAT